eukprot:SAG31_NODE_1406_length_8487_cov_4.584883_8_plen_100_part_00
MAELQRLRPLLRPAQAVAFVALAHSRLGAGARAGGIFASLEQSSDICQRVGGDAGSDADDAHGQTAHATSAQAAADLLSLIGSFFMDLHHPVQSCSSSL